MIGEQLGDYRILKKIGEGAMGVVYLAEHALIGKKAAVKILHLNLSNNREVVQRFFNEARSAGMVNDPGMVEIYDFKYTQNGRAYLVMEFLEGEALNERLKRDVRLDVDSLSVIGRQIADTLHAAHAQRIIHRDLKPDNVFLVPDRNMAIGIRVKVLDFGIAKLAGAGQAAGVMTAAGMMLGTPTYMSPEQCRGASNVDHRSDIYSLGCILYQMATGSPPFRGHRIGDVIASHMRTQPQSLRAFDPNLPAQLDAIVLRALAKEPDRRHQSMGELATELEALAPHVARPSRMVAAARPHMESGAVPMIRPGSQSMPVNAPHGAGSGANPQVQAGGKRLSHWIITAVLVLAAAAASAVIATKLAGSGKDDPPAKAADAAPVKPVKPVKPDGPDKPKVATPDAAPAVALKQLDLDSVTETKIRDKDEARKLFGNHMLALQWLGEPSRDARVSVTVEDGKMMIRGEQVARGDYVKIEGTITEVKTRYFKMQGMVETKVGHVNKGEPCFRRGRITFKASGKATYWRMRQMDNPCESVTDYVDIYVERLPD